MITQTFLFLLLGVLAIRSQIVLTDRSCGKTLSNLWLDVVVVVDNSVGMTNSNLNSVAANIMSVFALSTIGTNPANPKTTRVGLVTYGYEAQIKANLTQYKSRDDLNNNIFDDLQAVEANTTSYLEKGLSKAESLFAGTAGTSRSHYRQVVIVYASAYEGTDDLAPLPVAQRLRSHGVTIITVAYVQNDDDYLLNQLALIATPNNAFTNENNDQKLNAEIQNALLQANCFCPSEWENYRISYADPNSVKFGVCLQVVNMPAIWQAAKMSCRNRFKNAYLANEYNTTKHNFIFDKVHDTSGIKPPLIYHIGLSYSNNNWNWEQPNGLQVPNTQWNNWRQGYPIASSTMSAAQNSQSGNGAGWVNIASGTASANYVCEVSACDTDIYCSTDGS